jgi:hypothetical protein|nr:hypothetical protein [Thiocapsa sp.]
MVATVHAVLGGFPAMREVLFCCFSETDLAVDRRLLTSASDLGS